MLGSSFGAIRKSQQKMKIVRLSCFRLGLRPCHTNGHGGHFRAVAGPRTFLTPGSLQLAALEDTAEAPRLHGIAHDDRISPSTPSASLETASASHDSEQERERWS